MKSRFTGYAPYLGVSCIVGFVYFLIGQVLYPFLTEILWPPVGIALYFLLFGIMMHGTIRVLNRMRIRDDNWKNGSESRSKAYKNSALWLLVIFLAAGFLEFVYELGGRQLEPASSYIFLIDDSTSMTENDPNLSRANAINSIMSKQPADLSYMVYGFTEDAKLIKPLGSYEPDDACTFESNGNTDILTSLNTVLNDLTNGSIQGGNAPRILILSDGESFDWGWRDIAQSLRDNDVVVSCVGFGYDSDLLRNIAVYTGGAYSQADDINSLVEQMESAITSNPKRDLISTRAKVNMNWLYAIARILFLCIIGLTWSYMKYEAYYSMSATINIRIFRLSFVFCIISAFLVEFLLQWFWVSPFIARMLLCMLWALTPGTFTTDNTFDAKTDSKLLIDTE